MLDSKSSYREMIEARANRAASLAAKHGFDSRIEGSLLEIFNEHSSASVLFRSDHIVFERLHVDVTERRRHYGSNMLEAVIAIANEAELRLELIAEPPMHPNKADLSQRALQEWYRRHKFVDADEVLMSRTPDRPKDVAPTPALPSLLWGRRRDRLARYARNGLGYSEAASTALYSVALTFVIDWLDVSIDAVDRLNRTYKRI